MIQEGDEAYPTTARKYDTDHMLAPSMDAIGMGENQNDPMSKDLVLKDKKKSNHTDFKIGNDDESISLNSSDDVKIHKAKIRKSKSAKTIMNALDRMQFRVKQRSET